MLTLMLSTVAMLRVRAKGTTHDACNFESLLWSGLTRASFNQIDYSKFASVANLASANSARELMRVTKKKLKEE